MDHRFSPGSIVIYGGTGLCRVDSLTTLDMPDIPKDKLYYVLIPLGLRDGRIYAPVEGGRTVTRLALDKAGAQALIEEIPQIEPLPTGDDKSREALYREAIKSCDCRTLIRIIKTLYLKDQARHGAGKKTLSLDDRYFKQAEDQLYSELSFALDIPKEDMRDYIAKFMK